MAQTTEADVRPEAAGIDGDDEVQLSPAAIARVRALLQNEGRPTGAGLRVSVVGGGCSGLQYSLCLEDAPKEEDVIREHDGVRVFVDRDSLPYLAGTVVDFADGLYGAGFRFTNPRADRTCGCGSSFSV